MIEETLHSFIKHAALDQSTIALALSGGADSMALAVGLLRISSEHHLSLRALHVNYHLRGEDSMADEAFVRSFCTEHHIPLDVLDYDMSQEKSGIEEKARTIRQEFFLKTINQGKCEYVATAHTKSDQAETILFRLIRGTGIKGMRGMHALRNDGLIKPLLQVSRLEITAYLQSHTQPWREDLTNGELTYSRNIIRHKVLPVLTSIQAKALDNIVLFSEKLEHCSPSVSLIDFVHYYSPQRVLLRRSSGIPQGALYELLSKLNLRTTSSILKEVMRGIDQTGATILLSKGWQIEVLKTYLLFHKVPSTEYTKVMSISSTDQYVVYSRGLWEFSLAPQKKVEENISKNIKEHGVNNYASIETSFFPLTLRCVTIEDTLTPFGSQKSKRVIDLLKKSGYSQWERTHFPIFCDAQGEPLWLPGVAFSQNHATQSSSIIEVLWQ